MYQVLKCICISTMLPGFVAFMSTQYTWLSTKYACITLLNVSLFIPINYIFYRHIAILRLHLLYLCILVHLVAMYVWAEISVPPTCLTVSVQMIRSGAAYQSHPYRDPGFDWNLNGASLQLHHPTTLGATLPTVEPIMVFQGFSRSDIRIYQSHRVVLLILNLAVWDVKSRERRPCVASESHHSCHPSGRSSHGNQR